MACALAQNSVHAAAKSIQMCVGHKGLYRSGKAASMDAAGSTAVQKSVCQCEGESQFLMLCISGGDNILQIKPGRTARGPDLGKIPLKIIGCQGGNFLLSPCVCFKNVHCTENCPVSHGPAKLIYL